MLSSSFDDIVEVFMIQAEGVHLVGTLTHLNEKKGKVDGRVRFHDGRNMSFSSKIEDRDALSKRLRLVCRCIAAFYGADVVHQKLRSGHELVESGYDLNSVPQFAH